MGAPLQFRHDLFDQMLWPMAGERLSGTLQPIIGSAKKVRSVLPQPRIATQCGPGTGFENHGQGLSTIFGVGKF